MWGSSRSQYSASAICYTTVFSPLCSERNFLLFFTHQMTVEQMFFHSPGDNGADVFSLAR